MKFDFNGKIDVPEWVLSEINLLSQISTIKFRQILAQITKRMARDPSFDEEKMLKTCRDSKLSPDQTQCVLALLDYILSNAVKHHVDDETFSNELLQLGVPPENANAFVKLFKEQGEAIFEVQRETSLRFSRLTGMRHKITYLVGGSMCGTATPKEEEQKEMLDSFVTLNLKVASVSKTSDGAEGKQAESRSVVFSMNREKLLELVSEMKDALEIMRTD